MELDYTEIWEVYKKANFEELQNLFDVTQKLVEILSVKMIECVSPSWTRSSLAYDHAIKWSKAKYEFIQIQLYAWEKCQILQMQLEDGTVKWKNFNKLILTENYFGV